MGRKRASARWRLLLRLIKRDLTSAKVNALSLGSDSVPTRRADRKVDRVAQLSLS